MEKVPAFSEQAYVYSYEARYKIIKPIAAKNNMGESYIAKEGESYYIKGKYLLQKEDGKWREMNRNEIIE